MKSHYRARQADQRKSIARNANIKDNASDFLTAKELQAVANIENKIAVMIELGMEYKEIKQRLTGDN